MKERRRGGWCVFSGKARPCFCELLPKLPPWEYEILLPSSWTSPLCLLLPPPRARLVLAMDQAGAAAENTAGWDGSFLSLYSRLYSNFLLGVKLVSVFRRLSLNFSSSRPVLDAAWAAPSVPKAQFPSCQLYPDQEWFFIRCACMFPNTRLRGSACFYKKMFEVLLVTSGNSKPN